MCYRVKVNQIVNKIMVMSVVLLNLQFLIISLVIVMLESECATVLFNNLWSISDIVVFKYTHKTL